MSHVRLIRKYGHYGHLRAAFDGPSGGDCRLPRCLEGCQGYKKAAKSPGTRLEVDFHALSASIRPLHGRGAQSGSAEGSADGPQ